MNKKKTYGANGLMEWNCVISNGKTKLHLQFTGGSLTAYGVSPCEYTTENPIIQQIIERSDYFKKGRIFIVRETEGSGKYANTMVAQRTDDKVTKDEKPNSSIHKGGQAATVSNTQELNDPAPADTKDEAITIPESTVTETTTEEEETTDAQPQSENTDEAEALPTTTEDGKAIVDVTCWDDARDYLADEFGIAKSTIRSQVKIQEAATEHNIVFRGLE